MNKHSEVLVTQLEVYVDNFFAMSNDIQHIHLEKLSRAMLHGIHAIFSPPEDTGHNGFDPVTEKKIDEVDSIWAFYKEILGWYLDDIQYTIQPPPKKRKDIYTLLRKLLNNLRIALNQFQKLAGIFQHASLRIPIRRSLFNPLDMAKRGDTDFITITPILSRCLDDWRCFVQCMEKEPTSGMQVIMLQPS